MIRKIIIYFAFITMSVYTVNAYWFDLNGYTSIELFNRFPVLLAPANYAYTIWFLLITITLVYFMSHKASDNERNVMFKSNLQIALYTANAILHILVIHLWHNGQYMSAVILCGALLILIFSLYITYPLHQSSIKFRLPTALYFSWQLFVFFLMMNITVIYYEWSGFGLSSSLWTVIFLTILTLVSLHLKYHYEDWVSPLVFMWVFIGIAINNFQKDLLVCTAALFLSGVLLAGLYVLKKNRDA